MQRPLLLGLRGSAMKSPDISKGEALKRHREAIWNVDMILVAGWATCILHACPAIPANDFGGGASNTHYTHPYSSRHRPTMKSYSVALRRCIVACDLRRTASL